MSGTVSMLFANHIAAKKAYTVELQRQYGQYAEAFRHDTSMHFDATERARVAWSTALSKWHKAALGSRR